LKGEFYVVGAGPGGAGAAWRASREGLKVVVFDGEPARAGEYTVVELQTTTGATFAGREVAGPAMAGLK
jgi:thioredoxin reductase